MCDYMHNYLQGCRNDNRVTGQQWGMGGAAYFRHFLIDIYSRRLRSISRWGVKGFYLNSNFNVKNLPSIIIIALIATLTL
jgi:hypothetical protein